MTVRRALFALSWVALAVGAAASARAEDGQRLPNLAEMPKILRGFEAIEAWRLDEARVLAAEVLAKDPSNPLGMALVADVKMHLGDYAGAEALFARALESGAPPGVLFDAPLARAAREATAGYEEEVGAHFILRFTPGKDALLVPYAFETLDAARLRMGDILGWRPESKVIVELYPSAQTLAQVSTLTRSDIENSGTIALCRWNRLMATTPRAVVFGYSWRDTLAHELAHLIIGGASKNTVPIWLHEGIAKYLETSWRGEPGTGISVEQQQALRTAARSNKLIPFEKMHPSMAKLKSQEETSLAFAEVFTFIEYLVAKKGLVALRDVLAKMANGASDAEAIEDVFGESLTSLSKKWMRTLKDRPVTNFGSHSGRKLVIKEQPGTPDDKLHGMSKLGRRYARAADLLYARGRLKAAQQELEKAHRETQSPLISAKLAMVALATGDLDAAEKAARDAIDGTPDLAGPNITLAEILLRRSKPAEARAALEEAVNINPFDPRVHALMRAVLDPEKEPKKAAHAELALHLISGRDAQKVVSLGHGGAIQIHGEPFSRVYLRERREGAPRVATGLVTPTETIELRPGAWELELVPPSGPSTAMTINVLEGSDPKSPQLITTGASGT